MKWRPIDECPKDGGDYLMANDHHDAYGVWRHGQWAWGYESKPTHYLPLDPVPGDEGPLMTPSELNSLVNLVLASTNLNPHIATMVMESIMSAPPAAINAAIRNMNVRAR